MTTVNRLWPAPSARQLAKIIVDPKPHDTPPPVDVDVMIFAPAFGNRWYRARLCSQALTLKSAAPRWKIYDFPTPGQNRYAGKEFRILYWFPAEEVKSA